MYQYAVLGTVAAAKLAAAGIVKGALAAHHVIAAKAAVAAGGLVAVGVLDYGYLAGWFNEQAQGIGVDDYMKVVIAGAVERNEFKRVPAGEPTSAVLQAVTTKDGKEFLASRVIKARSIAKPLANALAADGMLVFE
jgi:hypothetical protein